MNKKSHLQKKQIINKNGKNQTVYVNPNENMTGTSSRSDRSSLVSDFLSPADTGSVVPTIDDLFDRELFEKHIKDENINLWQNEKFPGMAIANYSQKSQYMRIWDDATMHSRGLIFNTDTGEVLARPWKKFFNHQEPEAPDLSKATNIEVTDKMDGSLIIGYRDADGRLRGSTKGSLHSEMAEFSQKFLDDYGEIDEEWTPLFEVIYPENRIVINYGDTRDLFVLGAVHRSTGEVVGPDSDVFDNWEGPRTEVFHAESMEEVLSRPPRENAEGVIIRDRDTGDMVKVKQEDYVQMHAYATEVTTITIWDRMAKGQSKELLDDVPDELYDDLREHMESFNGKHQEAKSNALANRDRILRETGLSLEDVSERENRKRFAVTAKDRLSKEEFSLVTTATFSEHTLDDLIWKRIKPGTDQKEYLGKTFRRF